MKSTTSLIRHSVGQILPTAQSGNNLLAVGLGSGLESLDLASEQGPAQGKEGDGRLPQGRARNHQDLDRYLALGHLFHVPSVHTLGPGVGEKTRRGIAINNTNRRNSPPDR